MYQSVPDCWYIALALRLHPREIMALAATCRWLYALLHSPMLWESLLDRDWGVVARPLECAFSRYRRCAMSCIHPGSVQGVGTVLRHAVACAVPAIPELDCVRYEVLFKTRLRLELKWYKQDFIIVGLEDVVGRGKYRSVELDVEFAHPAKLAVDTFLGKKHRCDEGHCRSRWDCTFWKHCRGGILAHIHKQLPQSDWKVRIHWKYGLINVCKRLRNQRGCNDKLRCRIHHSVPQCPDSIDSVDDTVLAVKEALVSCLSIRGVGLYVGSRLQFLVTYRALNRRYEPVPSAELLYIPAQMPDRCWSRIRCSLVYSVEQQGIVGESKDMVSDTWYSPITIEDVPYSEANLILTNGISRLLPKHLLVSVDLDHYSNIVYAMVQVKTQDGRYRGL